VSREQVRKSVSSPQAAKRGGEETSHGGQPKAAAGASPRELGAGRAAVAVASSVAQPPPLFVALAL
jgi:hypothetical protein